MIVELMVAFFFVLLICFVMWALMGLFMVPVYTENMVSFLFVGSQTEKIEGNVRSYGWFRENRRKGGKLVIVDCGLTAEGIGIVQQLCAERDWLDYCPYQALMDYMELTQHCLENSEKL